MRTPEKVEKDKIDAYLKEIGAYVLKPLTYGYGASGAADRVCCIAGRFFSVEVKREGKTPTPLQERRMREVEAAGGKAMWGTAAKVIPEIEAWLREFSFGGPVQPSAAGDQSRLQAAVRAPAAIRRSGSRSPR